MPVPDGSQTLERGIRALLCLTERRDGVTPSSLGRELGVHRSVAQRLLASLARTGFARRTEQGAYVTGPALFAAADAARPPLHEMARPVLRRVAEELGATACLMEVAGDAAVATLVVEPPSVGPVVAYRVGHRDPLDRGAGSAAALASVPPDPDEPSSVTEVRAAGVARTHGEILNGAYGVAVPLHASGGVPMSMVIITPSEKTADRAEPVVAAAAREVESSVGRGDRWDVSSEG